MRPLAATESGDSVPFTRRSESSLPASVPRDGRKVCATARSSCLIASCRSTACVSSRIWPRASTEPPVPVVARRRISDGSRAGQVKLRTTSRASRISARAVGRTVESTSANAPSSTAARRTRRSSSGAGGGAGPVGARLSTRAGAPAGRAGGSSSARSGNEPSAARSIRAHGFCSETRSMVTAAGYANSMPVDSSRAAVIRGLAGVRERHVRDRGGAARGEREGLERGLHRQVAARLAGHAPAYRQVGLGGPEVHPARRDLQLEAARGQVERALRGDAARARVSAPRSAPAPARGRATRSRARGGARPATSTPRGRAHGGVHHGGAAVLEQRLADRDLHGRAAPCRGRRGGGGRRRGRRRRRGGGRLRAGRRPARGGQDPGDRKRAVGPPLDQDPRLPHVHALERGGRGIRVVEPDQVQAAHGEDRPVAVHEGQVAEADRALRVAARSCRRPSCPWCVISPSIRPSIRATSGAYGR